MVTDNKEGRENLSGDRHANLPPLPTLLLAKPINLDGLDIDVNEYLYRGCPGVSQGQLPSCRG